jgi:hypothetical protein
LTAIWYILWPFGTFCGHLVYIFPFWYVVPRKLWQPWFGWREQQGQLISIRFGKSISLPPTNDSSTRINCCNCQQAEKFTIQGPIMRLLNLQLQHQRTRRLELF